MMKKILFLTAVLFSLHCSIGWAEQKTEPEALQLKDLDIADDDAEDDTVDVNVGKEEATSKSVFVSPAKEQKNGKEENKKKKRVKKVKSRPISVEELQKIMDGLPEQDRKIVGSVRTQIAAWPRKVFEEISAYREFVINARNIAKRKYASLSPEAKSALETEKELKSRLSPTTMKILEELEVIEPN